MSPDTRPTHSSPASVWLDLASLLTPDNTPDALARPDEYRDWLAIYRLATAHMVAPTLYAMLDTRDQLDWVPQELRQALQTLAALNTERNQRLRAILYDTGAILNQTGLEPLLLKGAIALLPGQYPYAASRMLSDLDIAIVEGSIEDAFDALMAAGYYLDPDIEPIFIKPDPHHLMPLFHPSGDGYVELHHSLSRRWQYGRALSLDILRARAKPVTYDGIRFWIPCIEHRLLHNALHHQVSDQAYWSDRRSLRQLLEFAQLRLMPGANEIDWPQILQHLDTFGLADAVNAYLLAVERLFRQPRPSGIETTKAALTAERRFWRRLDHRLFDRALTLRWQLIGIAQRLPNLPGKLLTPTWYPAKYRRLRMSWHERASWRRITSKD